MNIEFYQQSFFFCFFLFFSFSPLFCLALNLVPFRIVMFLLLLLYNSFYSIPFHWTTLYMHMFMLKIENNMHIKMFCRKFPFFFQLNATHFIVARTALGDLYFLYFMCFLLFITLKYAYYIFEFFNLYSFIFCFVGWTEIWLSLS